MSKKKKRVRRRSRYTKKKIVHANVVQRNNVASQVENPSTEYKLIESCRLLSRFLTSFADVKKYTFSARTRRSMNIQLFFFLLFRKNVLLFLFQRKKKNYSISMTRDGKKTNTWREREQRNNVRERNSRLSVGLQVKQNKKKERKKNYEISFSTRSGNSQ